MEQVIQITALCMVGALLALVVRRGNPEQALLLVLGCVVLALLSLVGSIRELLEFLGALEELLSFLTELGERSGVARELFVPLYKTVGIALIVRLGGEVCRDAGEAALAAALETAGSICALLIALPLLRAVLSMLLELMG